MLRTRVLTLFVFLATSLAGSGCKQESGDRCERTADCSAGLRCSNNDEVGKEGICQVSEPIVGSSARADAAATGPAPMTGPAPIVVMPSDAATPDSRASGSATADAGP